MNGANYEMHQWIGDDEVAVYFNVEGGQTGGWYAEAINDQVELIAVVPLWNNNRWPEAPSILDSLSREMSAAIEAQALAYAEEERRRWETEMALDRAEEARW